MNHENKLYLNSKNIPLFGIRLDKSLQNKIEKKVELFKEKCPINSHFSFKFMSKNDKFLVSGFLDLGDIRLKSSKFSHDPYSAYLLFEDDMQTKLLTWKRERFSDKLNASLMSKG